VPSASGADRRVAVTGTVAADLCTAFEQAPIGRVLSRQRAIVNCNGQPLAVFRAAPSDLVGRRFEVLWPTHADPESAGRRISASLDASGVYADECVMKRVGGSRPRELFWCRVCGRALDPAAQHAAGIWTFEDRSSTRQIAGDPTAREREIAAQLIDGLTSQ
jgi:PAS domain-containing protein